jgi:kievitone hydratase
MNGVPFTATSSSMYRGSLLDITDPTIYNRFDVFSDIDNIYSDDGSLNATFPDYGFGTINAGQSIHTWSTIPEVEFDITFDLSSPALLNGGLGIFTANNMTISQWAAPAGKTTGSFSINGSTVEVDSENSRTWFDRQSTGGPSYFTWFELHVETGKATIPMSVWSWEDDSVGAIGFVTTRESAGIQSVVPLISITDSNRTYTSEVTGHTYPLDWTIQLGDGTRLDISSVREDQELYQGNGSFAAYQGYITVSGIWKGCQQATGYGLVEVVAPGAISL